MPDDIQTLYAEATKDLCASSDPRLEELKWRIARAEAYEHEITPALLVKLFGETPDWAMAAFAGLRSGGFVQHHFSHFGWTRLDRESVAHQFDMLAAIEAVVALRFRYLDISPVLPALEHLVAVIDQHAQKHEPLEVCLNAQRLFLVLVAAVDAPELFREYAATAKASLAYAWSTSLEEGGAACVSNAVRKMVGALADRDGVTAARAATFLRGMPYEAGIPLIPMSH